VQRQSEPGPWVEPRGWTRRSTGFGRRARSARRCSSSELVPPAGRRPRRCSGVAKPRSRPAGVGPVDGGRSDGAAVSPPPTRLRRGRESGFGGRALDPHAPRAAPDQILRRLTADHAAMADKSFWVIHPVASASEGSLVGPLGFEPRTKGFKFAHLSMLLGLCLHPRTRGRELRGD